MSIVGSIRLGARCRMLASICSETRTRSAICMKTYTFFFTHAAESGAKVFGNPNDWTNTAPVIIGRAATYAGPDSSASLRRRRANPSSLRATCQANHRGSVRPWRWPLRCFFQRQQRKCESAAGTPHTALGTSSQLRIGHAGPRRAFVDPIGRRPRNL